MRLTLLLRGWLVGRMIGRGEENLRVFFDYSDWCSDHFLAFVRQTLASRTTKSILSLHNLHTHSFNFLDHYCLPTVTALASWDYICIYCYIRTACSIARTNLCLLARLIGTPCSLPSNGNPT